MSKVIAIQSNNLREINIKTDTTLLLALEASLEYGLRDQRPLP